MRGHLSGWIDSLAAWRRYAALMAALFIVRGLFLLSVLPPFEGWDEYQHLAYVQFVLENGRSPSLHKDSKVPRSLYSELVKYPHSEMGAEQLRAVGARSYAEFWQTGRAPPVRTNAPDICLYQAQHSGFYYRLVSPFYAWLVKHGGFLCGVTGLRLLNVLFGGGAIFVSLLAVGRLVKPGALRYLLGLLIATQPLFLVNCARVANDGIALLLGTCVVALLLVMPPRRYLISATVAGAALGLGILGKAINLGILPFAVFVFIWMAWQKRLRVRQAVSGALVLILVGTAVSGHYFYSNLKNFGLLTPMQEAVHNRTEGRTRSDFVEAARDVDWSDEVSRRYLRHSLWRGGWSWLRAPGFWPRSHGVLICLSILGACFLWKRSFRERRRFLNHGDTALNIVILWLGITAGLCYHMLQTQAALGVVATNIWYAAVTFPWLLMLVCQGFAGYPWRWLTNVMVLNLLLVFLLVEIYGTLFEMVRTYAGSDWRHDAWDRLARMHLPGMGPEMTFPALAVVLVLYASALGVWAARLRLDRAQRGCIAVSNLGTDG